MAPHPAPAAGDAQSPDTNTPPAAFVSDDKTKVDEDKNDAAPGETAEAPGFLRRTRQKLDLSPILLMGMFKGSLAPLICIAMYQAAPARKLLTTLVRLVTRWTPGRLHGSSGTPEGSTG